MSTSRFTRAGRCALAILLTAAVCGCSNEGATVIRSKLTSENDKAIRSSETAGRARYADLLDKHQTSDRHVLRMRADEARHRLWVLTVERVYVYDTEALTLIRRIKLPDWSMVDVDFMCPPDIVLDRRGTAFVSSNVEPRLFQIGPDFETSEHQLRLISGKQLEIGFGSLVFEPDGSLFGMSAVAGLVFRIDLAGANATEVVSPRPRTGGCALAPGTLS
ncbi:MAG: hypothetical protein JWM26_533 [Betaproteobacteria bacterium]|nr:hypothetical protein [Betaproteobacteria bacterium]